jgi:TonB-linked SusC/RagA family outer membrane protein
VTDTTGTPIPGAKVRIRNSEKVTLTDAQGRFSIDASTNDMIDITFIGYQPFSVNVRSGLEAQKIILHLSYSKLNEIQIIGYGTTTKKLNPGSISSITATEIEKQPVSNPLAALSGRMPGVFIQTTNGLPGGNINIQIRGKGSILAGTNPLFIVDGVPFSTSIGGNYTAANGNLSGNSVGGNISPLNSINPNDIESITVLKDADATSIYGSRGSNGVVLITTKSGKSGKTKVDINFREGYDQAADLPRVLDLSQYLSIRKEAFANDGKTPSADPASANYAPDLTVWNTGQETNWPKYLMGGTGHVTDAQATISGGSGTSNFSFGGNFHSETPYLAGENLYQRGSLHFNFRQLSEDHKFEMQFSNSLTIDDNRLANLTSIATFLTFSPDYPLYDQSGNYNWFYSNPVAQTNRTSRAATTNTINNVLLQYHVSSDLSIKASGGYNQIGLAQTEIAPSSALKPGATNFTYFGDNKTKTVIVEPQLEYKHLFSGSSFDILFGGTYQNTVAQGQFIDAENFSSEELMQNYASAQSFSPSNSYTQYKYASVFGRVTYNLKEMYILNMTVRRDGSSRFGPGLQYGDFGSIGGAWIFSEERPVKDVLPFLSYGKIRASYGSTGNDQITDYQYLSTYGSSGYIYQSISGLQPSRIANADFHWETTYKFDAGLELGAWNDRILLSVDFYRNTTSDQLVNYKIPYQSGFATYQANLPAVVRNTGWEFSLTSKNISNRSFGWSTSFNLTIPRNVLVSFDNFETSSYAQLLAIGYDITRIAGYQFLGVDPATGQATYASQSGLPSTTPFASATIGKRTPDLYGGFGNTFNYGNFQLDVFGQFTKQMSQGSIIYTPGISTNNFVTILNRWQQPGDQTNVPKSTLVNDSKYALSSANMFDASYFRIKNISFSYTFKSGNARKIRLSNLKIYAEAQNMITFWHQNAALLDPESGPLNTSINLPPAKTIVAGFQLTL